MNSKFSKIGFILAVAGSAIGLGNAWKFPTLVGQNGGSAFILLYLFFTLGVAFVIFLAELSLGKISQKDPVNAYKILAPSNKKLWSFAGFVMIGAILVVSFYTIVIGWILRYFFFSITQNLSYDLDHSKQQFTTLIQDDFFSQLFCFTIIFFVVFYTVSKGIKNGIEKLNIWIMPLLFFLLTLMLVFAMSKNGFTEAVQFLFFPDFSKINISSILEALGLAFFSLSLGVGTIITYSANLPDRANFISSTLSIIFINLLVGILMGLIVFTFIFEFHYNPNQSGDGLVFISLATLFAKLDFIGYILGAMFFLSLIFAGITSAVSMIEPFTFYLINNYNFTRKKALLYIGAVVYILGILCIVSSLKATSFSILSMSFFDILDFLSSQIIMPIGGILVAVFVGFIMKKESLKTLFKPYLKGFFFELWYFFLRFISPVAVAIAMITAFMK
ncbi:sodium-dependent transporter [Campylobacter sp. MIT 21-1685]|uniref:sodium-dependent transporter n=1 Tax=unclassified Campylobacter TaxID=2593542 RepID=UPI00224B5189|nr:MULTISPECIES: sodium-dependent transporter [unclassified Campylobacter]MCX2682987.1 sodium-dependent transporter [Campylobacter sp. MIT 21-1684]MCX2751269.1 sodium-dependent transporter [Campylobacter sp. MIT 21-1682]MCX2807468.1 sodium-dependent transporter [Campylobacter sp. MIT 21-1685]